ncbi:MAG: methionyl-tRNA formyltransferase [Paludibacteraceae bacterium]|nr:methionyl-tRNA formyltransferase [Paludibacteraceae bacterium]MBQ7747632.1 methionyl-tRNA formyltransferase [Paludibacteraceae bacterium]
MNSKDIRIVFMGTPEFAVGSLKALVEGGYNVVGVVTMPDKPAGRGHKIQYSAVKQYALEKGLKLMQPEKLKDEAFISELKALNADLQIVVAFRMLPEIVWSMPPMGTFNLHGSLLPQYRGAAPINWAIINGDKETGVTTFMLKHEIDTGNIILQEKTPIVPEDNIGTVYDRLMEIGAGLVVKTVDLIAEGNVKTLPQESSEELRPAPKIFKETCRLDFSKKAEQLHNLVRGLSPYPAAWMELENESGERRNLKVYETEAEVASHQEKPGTIISDGKKTLKVSCADGYLKLKSVQLSGKRRMTVQEMLCGMKIEAEEIVL